MSHCDSVCGKWSGKLPRRPLALCLADSTSPTLYYSHITLPAYTACASISLPLQPISGSAPSLHSIYFFFFALLLPHIEMGTRLLLFKVTHLLSMQVSYVMSEMKKWKRHCCVHNETLT